MKHPQTYENEPYRTELDVEVVELGEAGGRRYAVLDDTILYPGGGGQPPDRGRLGDTPVEDVQRHGEAIRHFLGDRSVAPGPARLTLDWERRYDHMQQHTAQHLLTAVAADRFGWETTSFHLGAERSDIELEVESLSDADREALEEATAVEVRKARPVNCRRVAPADMGRLAVRTRGLPDDHRGDVRLVEIEGIDLNTCGGTHVASTAEIEALKLLDTEAMRGGTRLYWVAGRRARQRLALHERRCSELRRLLEASDDELVEVARAKLARSNDMAKRLRTVESALANELGRRLASADARVAEMHFDRADGGFLQLLARRFAAAAGDRLGLFTSTLDDGALFVVVAGPESGVDMQRIGRRVASALDGRGGGSGTVFQGKASALTGRAAALKLIREEVEN